VACREKYQRGLSASALSRMSAHALFEVQKALILAQSKVSTQNFGVGNNGNILLDNLIFTLFLEQNNLSSQRCAKHINLISQSTLQNSGIRLKYADGIVATEVVLFGKIR